MPIFARAAGARRVGRLVEYACMVAAVALLGAMFAAALGAGAHTLSAVVANAL